jgi:hypothetical protein
VVVSTLRSADLGALLLLMAAHFDLSVIAIEGIILLIGIVKKDGIMHVDFAQHVERSEGLTARKRSTRPACCAFGRLRAAQHCNHGGLLESARVRGGSFFWLFRGLVRVLKGGRYAVGEGRQMIQ